MAMGRDLVRHGGHASCSEYRTPEHTDARPALVRRTGVGGVATWLRQLSDCRGVGLLGALAVARLEAGDAAAGVEDLLLAGVERVALRADLDGDVARLLGAAGVKVLPQPQTTVVARSRVNSCLHGVLFDMVPGRPAHSIRCATSMDVNRNRLGGMVCRSQTPAIQYARTAGTHAQRTLYGNCSRIPRGGRGPRNSRPRKSRHATARLSSDAESE